MHKSNIQVIKAITGQANKTSENKLMEEKGRTKLIYLEQISQERNNDRKPMKKVIINTLILRIVI